VVSNYFLPSKTPTFPLPPFDLPVDNTFYGVWTNLLVEHALENRSNEAHQGPLWGTMARFRHRELAAEMIGPDGEQAPPQPFTRGVALTLMCAHQ
jgi:hypothetical protein